MKLYHNQRQYSRSKVSIAATLSIQDGKTFGVKVVDLSMGGIFIQTSNKLKNGTRCQVSMLLGHTQHELPILADAVVVRTVRDGVALRFEFVKLESIPSVQSLIVEHADDPDQTELEFSSHGGWVFSPK